MSRNGWIVLAVVLVLIGLAAFCLGAGGFGRMGFRAFGHPYFGMMGPWMMGGPFFMFLWPVVFLVLLGLLISWFVRSAGSGSQPPAATAKCPNCGQPVQTGWKHCANCGTALGG
jgi:uncharacterized membrane protein